MHPAHSLKAMDADVQVDIQHTYDGDLTITLERWTSPLGSPMLRGNVTLRS